MSVSDLFWIPGFQTFVPGFGWFLGFFAFYPLVNVNKKLRKITMLLMGNSLQMTIFNSELFVYQRVTFGSRSFGPFLPGETSPGKLQTSHQTSPDSSVTDIRYRQWCIGSTKVYKTRISRVDFLSGMGSKKGFAMLQCSLKFWPFLWWQRRSIPTGVPNIAVMISPADPPLYILNGLAVSFSKKTLKKKTPRFFTRKPGGTGSRLRTEASTGTGAGHVFMQEDEFKPGWDT